MVYIKASLVVVLVTLGVVLGFMFLTFDTDYELNVAMEAYLQGENEKAETVLNKLEGSVGAAQLNLYKGYIARGKGELRQSQDYLLLAEGGVKDNTPSVVRQEILWNRCLNALLLHDYETLAASLKKGEGLEDSAWYKFFRGVQAYYVDRAYEKALTYWQDSDDRPALSGWMRKAFDQVFTPSWQQLKVSHCKIEGGDYVAARGDLEQQKTMGTSDEISDRNLLIGLTYIQEAGEKPDSANMPYYKLAFSYFSKISLLSDRYDGERRHITATLNTLVGKLLEAKDYRDLAYYAGLLEALDAREDLAALRESLLQNLDGEIALKRWDVVQILASQLNRLINDTSSRQAISDRFDTLLTQLLGEEKVDLLVFYWEVARLFSKDPQRLATKFQELVTAKVLATLEKDSRELRRTRTYLSFLHSMNLPPNAQAALCQQLMSRAKTLWLSPEGASKACTLSKMINSFPGPEVTEAVHKNIEDVVAAVYEEAMKNDNTDVLLTILDAVRSLNLTKIVIDDAESIDKHLQMASAWYSQQDYDKALQRVLWIKTLSPNLRDAVLLEALIHYRLGHYPQALVAFQKLDVLPLSAQEPYSVTEYLVGDRLKGAEALAKASATETLSRDAVLRVGFGVLGQKSPRLAWEWLKGLQQPDDEVGVAHVLVSLQEGKLDAALNTIETLSESFKNLPEVVAIKAFLLQQRKKDKEAARILESALEASTEDSVAFSLPFQLFRKDILSAWDPHLVAAELVLDKDAPRAEALLRQMSTTRPELLLERGRLYLHMKLYADALQDLSQVASQSDDALKMPAMALLAVAQEKTGCSLEAFDTFQRYFKKGGDVSAVRNEWSQTLMHLRRFDLACAVLSDMQKAALLTPDLYEPYIQCLVRTGHADDAINQIVAWARGGALGDVTRQFSLLQPVAIAKANGLVVTALKHLSNLSALSTNEKVELANLLYLLGKIPQAYDVVAPLENELQGSPRGLEVLVRLHDSLSQREEAFTMARLALQLDPMNTSMTSFLYKNESDPTVLQQRLQDLRQQRKTQNTLSAQYSYGRRLVDLAKAVYKSDTSSQLAQDLYVELKEAKFLFETLTDKHNEIPEGFFILGEACRLTDSPEMAMKAYDNAVALDPTYAEALKAAGLLQKKQKAIPAAIQKLSEAVRWDSSDADAWQQLGDLYVEREDFYEAKDAYSQAIRYKPQYQPIYLALGRTLLQLHNLEDAKSALEQALSLNGQDKEAMTLLMTALHDPSWNSLSPDERKAQETRVYEQLHALDPALAEKVHHDLTANDEPEGAEVE